MPSIRTRTQRSVQNIPQINIGDDTTLKGRLIPYAVPWMVTGITTFAAEIAHLCVNDTATTTAYGALVTAAGGSALTWYLRRIGARLGKYRRELYTINAGALTLGSTAVVVTGLEGETFTLWAIGGLFLNVANMVHTLAGPKESEAKEPKWSKIEAEVGLAKYDLEKVESNGKGTVKARIRAKEDSGVTGEDFAKKIPALASALRLGKGRMVATVDPDDSSLIYMTAQVADLLKTGVRWWGPSAAGASIADAPIPVALYDDGEQADIDITGQLPDRPQRNVSHLLVMGATGAGKTWFGRTTVADMLTRRELTVWYANVTKGMQDFGCLRHGIDWFITEEKELRPFFKILKKVIKARTEFLGSKGMASWRPGCGLNFIVVWLEEAADYASDSDEYDHLLRAARSAGMWIVTSLQRADYTNISTNARANHGSGMCFGINDSSDVSFVLSSHTVGAGADPSWGDKKPGYAYLEGLGITEERWPMVLRTPFSSEQEIADTVSFGAAMRDPLDDVTVKAAGALYGKRTVYTTPLVGEGDGAAPTALLTTPEPGNVDMDTQETPETDSVPVVPEDEEIEDVTEEQVAKEVADLREMFSRPEFQDPEGGFEGLRLEDPMENADPEGALTFGATNEDDALSRDDARDLIFEQLDNWLRQGRTEFTPSDLSEIWLKVDGDGRSWWNRLKNKLLEREIIAQSETYAGYMILRSPLTDMDGE
ncbi:hypothetical protein [Streptomyces sp. NPDC127197]|uniref:hypothetical protein n=1 Tax=Streptomyces sp. NPDC127197 TaxID=3345388 RepID=UPI0036352CFC